MRLTVFKGYIALVEDIKKPNGTRTSRGVIGLGRYTEEKMNRAKQLLNALLKGEAEIREDSFGHKYVIVVKDQSAIKEN